MPDRLPFDRLRQSVLGGLDAALMATALGIMCALIVYAPLGAPAASFGLATVAMGLVVGGGAAMLLNREIVMVFAPTATSALIAATMVGELDAAGLVHGDYRIVLTATAIAGVASGLVPLALAGARAGSALKFIPYPVLMGFANSIGLSLIISVVPFALGHDYLGRIVEAGGWLSDWRPAAFAVSAVGTIAGYACARLLPAAPAAFIALASATLVHHGIAALWPDASLGPLLAFGHARPIPDIGAAWASWSALGGAGWSIVLQSAATLGILNALFTMLVAAALTRAHDAPVDGNRLLAKLGGGTVVGAVLIGLPIATIASVSKVIRAPRVIPSIALSVYLVAITAILMFGDRIFALIPKAAVASAVFVIARAQYDLATAPMIQQALRRGPAGRAALGPLAISMLVVAIAVVRSLAAALFVGAIAAACLLALELRRSVVLAVRDGHQRRSRRVWTRDERGRLDAVADRIVVIELAHWLYFGTADELARLLDLHTGARWLVLDARRIAGIDLTAARSLVHAAQRVALRESHLVLAGIAPGDARLRAIAALRIAGHAALEISADVDETLERAEQDLIGDDVASASPSDANVLGLEPDDVERLDRWLEPSTLAAGRTLFRMGDPGDALFIIRDGRIKLWVDGEGGARIRLLTFGRGGMFGEMAMLDGRPRSTHAEAEVDSELAMLTRDRLGALAEADPALHARLLRALALQLIDRLRATTTMLQQMG